MVSPVAMVLPGGVAVVDVATQLLWVPSSNLHSSEQLITTSLKGD